MVFRLAALTLLSLALAGSPAVAVAQNAPYSQLVITTKVAPGMQLPSTMPTVTVQATIPQVSGIVNTSSSQGSYPSNFNNETRHVNFVPGSYAVWASGAPGYYFSYSEDCSGFTPLSGALRGCTITLSNTPPPPTFNCISWFGSNSCTAPAVLYTGPMGQAPLTCAPAYQTVSANRAATFTASGGNPGGYNWTTTDRTSLNVGASFTTVLQTTGVQTVIVSNGVQNATCTVNVTAATNAAVSYTNPQTGTPSIVASYIPSYLPNTGFGPADSAAVAFALVLVLAAGFVFAPYVRKAFATALG